MVSDPVSILPFRTRTLISAGREHSNVSMNIHEAEDEPCEQCGLCCKIFGDSVTPTAENIFCWIEQKRLDILQYFSACKSDGTWVHCSELKPDELSDLIVVEMRDPVTQDYLPVCPFLVRAGRRKYSCRIHDTKPEMCSSYQPWVWGETYFNKCQALKKIDIRSRWRE
jgi:Fe-S-cluster containining protein